MPDIGDILSTIGRGALTGGRGLLTGYAMAQAARAGRDPFAILTERDVQQAQLQQLQAQQAMQRAVIGMLGGGALPATIPYALGTGGALMSPGPGARMAGMQLSPMPAEAGGAGLGFGGGFQPSVSFGPGGTSISLSPAPPETLREVEAGTISPTTGQPFRAGERVGRTVIGVKPSKLGLANRQRVALIDSALQGFNATYVTRINPTTGQPDPKGIFPHESLPSATEMGGLVGIGKAVLPRPFTGIGTQVRAAFGNAAAQALNTGEGTVVTFVKAMGDAANAAIPEQERALRAFLPNSSDTREQAALKIQLTPRVLAAVREKLANVDPLTGEPADNAGAWNTLYTSALELERTLQRTTTGAGTTAGPSAVSPAPSPGPGAGAPAFTREIDAIKEEIRALGKPAGRTLKRVRGGTVPAGRTAIVGEAGPEMVRGPVRVLSSQQLVPRLAQQSAQAAEQFKKHQKALEQTEINKQMFGVRKIPPPKAPPSMIPHGLTQQDLDAMERGARGTIMYGPDGNPVFVPSP